VFGCLAGGDWCQVGLSGGKRGWCTGKSLRQLAVATAVPVVKAVLPTATPDALTAREGKIAYVGVDGNLWIMNWTLAKITLTTKETGGWMTVSRRAGTTEPRGRIEAGQ
jgi:hypothetical protein